MPVINILNDAERLLFDTPPRFSKEDRQRYFSIPSELKSSITRIHPIESRIGFILQLGYFRSRARFFNSAQFGKRDINHVAKTLSVEPPTSLTSYAGSLVTRHRIKILDFLNWESYDSSMTETLVGLALNFAAQKEQPKFIFDALTDACWKHQVAIPSFSELNTIITDAFNESEKNQISNLRRAIKPAHSELLDSLLTPITAGSRTTTPLASYKNIDQSMRPKDIKQNVNNMIVFKDMFDQLADVYDELNINDKATRYYAEWVRKADIQQLTQFTDKENIYLHLLGFVKHHYFARQDSLVDALMKSVTSTLHKASSKQAEHERSVKEERDKAIHELSKSHKSISKLAKEIISIVESVSATPNEKYHKIEELVFDYQKNDEIDYSLLEDLDNQLRKESKNHTYYQLLESLSLRLQLKATPIVRALNFDSTSKAKDLLEAVDHFQESEGNVGKSPPIKFLSKQDRANVERNDFSIPLYKCLLFIYISKAIKSGDLNLAYSYRFRSIQDYMIDKEYWEARKYQILRECNLLEYIDGEAYLAGLKLGLHEKYKVVNKHLADGINTSLTFKDGRVSRVSTPKTDFQEESFIADALSQDGYIPILQLLKEVNQVCQFTADFKHLSPKNVKMKPKEETLMAGILAKGCNIGLGKLASISAGIQEHTLHNTVNWFFSLENIRKANNRIVDAIHNLKLSSAYLKDPEVLHSSSDGRKVNVDVDCLHANHSYKYFGKDKGVTIYTFIDEKQSLFHNSVFSASDREAPYVIDGLLQNEVTDLRQVHSTDTHGYTEQIFAVSHFLGIAFAPRLTNIGNQQIYSFSARKTFYDKGYRLLPSRPVSKNQILDHWDDILRFIATIKMKQATASQLFKRLSSYSKEHPLYRALKEFGRVIKSQFILTYFDDEDLRQQIQKQLNRVELSNRFSRAVFFDNDQAFQEGVLADQEVATACKLLLQNSIILWNYLYLSDLVADTSDPDDRRDLIESISQGSVITWKHVNLRGEYDFRRKASNDARFDMDKIRSIKL
jgi:TnpA family transposase